MTWLLYASTPYYSEFSLWESCDYQQYICILQKILTVKFEQNKATAIAPFHKALHETFTQNVDTKHSTPPHKSRPDFTKQVDCQRTLS